MDPMEPPGVDPEEWTELEGMIWGDHPILEPENDLIDD